MVGCRGVDGGFGGVWMGGGYGGGQKNRKNRKKQGYERLDWGGWGGGLGCHLGLVGVVVVGGSRWEGTEGCHW